MKLIYGFAVFFFFVSTCCCSGEEVPQAGSGDTRIRYIDYNADEVVKILCFYGYSTHIQLSPTEKVVNFAMGDKDAWDVADLDNHIFLKPKAKKPATNMQVITNKRVYNFYLDGKWLKKKDLGEQILQTTFRYPEEDRKKAEARKEAANLEKLLSKTERPTAYNWNYWGKGSPEVMPVRAWDNGRFTFIKIPNNRDMPAVYTLNPRTKTESLVNTHINPAEPDTIIIQKVDSQFVLRRGEYVACLYNESYTLDGLTNKRATTVPGVRRVIKKENAENE